MFLSILFKIAYVGRGPLVENQSFTFTLDQKPDAILDPITERYHVPKK